MPKHGLAFPKIEYIEAIWDPFNSPSDGEVEPLSVSFTIGIFLQQ